MNASLQGLWNYYFHNGSRRRCDRILVTSNGRALSHDEAKKYVRYCLGAGFEDLHSCPDFETIKSRLR